MMDSLKIVPLPAFKDNYIWLLRNKQFAAVVDPGDAVPVLNYLKQEKLELTAILNTHHHNDHVGGNLDLLRHFTVPVFGPRNETIPGVTHPLAEGDQVNLPQLALTFSVLDIPGHTAGHIAYYGANSLFCGDTLFACGCGRLFEGTPQQMVDSLAKLVALADSTAVYCGHEYTLANIRFALVAEPDNADLRERLAMEQKKRDQGMPTLPSHIGLEKKTNPFLRCHEASITREVSAHHGTSLSDSVKVFTALREWKNTF